MAAFRLRFTDPQDEQRFKAFFVDSHVRPMQIFLLLGCLIFFVFNLWDEMINPAQAHVARTIRFAVVCPLIAGVAASLSLQRLRPVVEAVVCLAPLSALVGVVVIFDRLDAYAHSAAAILLLEMFCFVTLRVRFEYFLFLVTATVVIYDSGHLLAPTGSSTLFLINNMYVLTASTLGLFATFVQERGYRQRYLDERVLEAARADAERADRAKSRLIARASHDLRQPIHALGLYVHALAGRPHEAAVDPGYRQMESALHAVEDMFESLLDLSRLTAGGVRPSVAPVALRPLFADLRFVFERTARERGIRLRVRCGGQLVLSDAPLLKQILQNLVGNALRYTERGGVLLGCRRAGERVRVEVWDTGCGIPEDKLDAVFEEFLRLDPGRRAADGGLGIGLAIVKESARLLGHRVAVRSCLGRGSCFSIELPLAHAAADPAVPAAGLAGPVPAASLDQFVVVIDDDPSGLESTGWLLREWGCTALLARDGHDACAQLQGHDRTPDLIVADFDLGHQTGPEAVAEVRRVLAIEVPAVLVSGRSDGDARAQAAVAGLEMQAKPLSPPRLRALVAAAAAPMDGDAADAAVTPAPGPAPPA